MNSTEVFCHVCVHAPGKCALPIADCGIGWSESCWWSLSTIRAGQGFTV